MIELPFAKPTNALDTLDSRQFKIPANWVLAKLEDLAEINPRSIPSVTDEKTEVSFIPMACVEEETGRVDTSTTRRYGEVKKGYTPFTNGDIIFAKITPCMENGKIAILNGLVNKVGFGSTEFHVIRPKANISREFIFYHLVNKDFRKKAQRCMRGSAGQQRVPADFLSRTRIPLPPLAEQQKIASILSKVDDLIQKTDEIIEQTQRLKKGLMQRLLTKGLKHSTFKRTIIGDLPANWQVSTIGQECEVGTGGTPDRTQGNYFGGEIPWLKTGEINFNIITSTEESITKEGLANSSAKIYPVNTVVYAMYGQGTTRGRSAILGIECAINQAVAAIKVGGKLEPLFVFYYLQNQYHKIRSRSQGTNQLNFNLSLVQGLHIPIPPIDEQKRIIHILKSIEDYICCEEAIRSRYTTLKKGLMQQLLTGQIRVKI